MITQSLLQLISGVYVKYLQNLRRQLLNEHYIYNGII